jgi:hypothetical protein
MIGTGYFVHTAWGGTGMDNFGFCGINTVETARVAWSRSVRRPTGAALQLKNLAQWNFWKGHGALHRIIPVPPHASPMLILTPTIIRNGIHKRDTEEGVSAMLVPGRFGW